MNRIEELEEILNEAIKQSSQLDHFQKYVDYLFKVSESEVKIEVVRELNSVAFLKLSTFDQSIFYYHLRRHMRDLLIAVIYLKSRFIGDPRWLNLENLHFDPNENQIKVCNFIYIGHNYNFSKDKRYPNFQSERKLDDLKDKSKHFLSLYNW